MPDRAGGKVFYRVFSKFVFQRLGNLQFCFFLGLGNNAKFIFHVKEKSALGVPCNVLLSVLSMLAHINKTANSYLAHSISYWD